MRQTGFPLWLLNRAADMSFSLQPLPVVLMMSTMSSRRDFLKAGAAILTHLSLSRFARAEPVVYPFPELGTVPILQTMTTETTAQFRVFGLASQDLRYSVADDKGASFSLSHLEHFVHPSDLSAYIDHLQVKGLRVGVDYKFRVTDAISGKVIDERSFSAFDMKMQSPRVALISCMSDDFPRIQRDMWQVVDQANPDFIFILGDAAYIDEGAKGTEASLWHRHVTSRQRTDLFRLKRLRPVLSVWDDHDYGLNNGDRTFPLKHATRQMFEAMFGSSLTPGLVAGPSLAREISFAGQRFYLLDGRFYRTKRDKNGTHWGDDQEEWLLDRVGSSSQPAWLINGSQFFGGYSGYESFEAEQPVQFARVLSALGQSSAPVVLVSGDVHFSELMRIEPELLGYETFEITSSSIHSYYSAGFRAKKTNPRRMVGNAHYNFVIADCRARPNGAGLDMHVTSLGPKGGVLFERDLSITR